MNKPLLGPCDSYQLEPFAYPWAWDRLSKAIFAVSVAQPYSLWSAVEEMLAARAKLGLAITHAFSSDNTRPE